MSTGLTIGLVFGAIGMASASGADHGEAGFNPSEFIIHHIQDAHEIHIIGDVHIPLPVIAYAPESGQFDIFLSSALHHGAHHGSSGLWYTMDHGTLAAHDHDPSGHDHGAHGDDHAEEDHAGHDHDAHHAGGVEIVDLSITKSIFGMLLMMGLVLLLFASAGRGYAKRKGQAPKGLQNALEPMVLFIRDEVAIPSIGKKKADRYLPFLLTVFFFIFFSNLLGLIPFVGGFNITGTLGITAVLATLVFVITTVSGNKHYWSHILWPAGVPLPIKFILVPIEIASIFIKPFVLMVRLTANITAGHIIILAFTSLIFILGEQFGGGVGIGTGVFSTLFMIFMYMIEFLVAFLQAYVFTLLAALYFGEATHEAHH
ncbi:MAG: F0F1 ATP synthase subunit A [Flavobacteriales bacterium]